MKTFIIIILLRTILNSRTNNLVELTQEFHQKFPKRNVAYNILKDFQAYKHRHFKDYIRLIYHILFP